MFLVNWLKKYVCLQLRNIIQEIRMNKICKVSPCTPIYLEVSTGIPTKKNVRNLYSPFHHFHDMLQL